MATVVYNDAQFDDAKLPEGVDAKDALSFDDWRRAKRVVTGDDLEPDPGPELKVPRKTRAKKS